MTDEEYIATQADRLATTLYAIEDAYDRMNASNNEVIEAVLELTAQVEKLRRSLKPRWWKGLFS